MTTLAKTAFGAALFMAPDTITPLVKIAELNSITPATKERGTIDVTTHDSASQAREFIAEGIYDPGEIEISGHLIAGSAADTAFNTALNTGAKQDLKLVFKAATGTHDIICEGFVTSYSPADLTVDGKQEFSATLKVTGATTQAVSV